MIYFCKLLKLLKDLNLLYKENFFIINFVIFMDKILKKKPSERSNIIQLIKYPFIINHLNDKTNFTHYLTD